MTHACLSSNTATFPSFLKQNKIKQHTKKKQTSNNNKTKQKKILVLCFLSAQRKKSECQDKPTDGCWFFLMPASGHQGHTLNYISGVLFSVAAAVLPENASATFKLLQDMRPLVSPKECCPIRTDSDLTNANSGSGFQVLHNLGKKKALRLDLAILIISDCPVLARCCCITKAQAAKARLCAVAYPSPATESHMALVTAAIGEAVSHDDPVRNGGGLLAVT